MAEFWAFCQIFCQILNVCFCTCTHSTVHTLSLHPSIRSIVSEIWLSGLDSLNNFRIFYFTYFVFICLQPILIFFLQEKPAVPQPQSSNGNLGLPKSSTSNTVDTVDSSNHIKPKTSSCSNGSAGDQPDDYEKEERRRAAQRVLGKQG